MTIYLTLHNAAMDVSTIVGQFEIKAGRAIPIDELPHERGASYLDDYEDYKLYRLLFRRACFAEGRRISEYGFQRS